MEAWGREEKWAPFSRADVVDVQTIRFSSAQLFLIKTCETSSLLLGISASSGSLGLDAYLSDTRKLPGCVCPNGLPIVDCTRVANFPLLQRAWWKLAVSQPLRAVRQVSDSTACTASCSYVCVSLNAVVVVEVHNSCSSSSSRRRSSCSNRGSSSCRNSASGNSFRCSSMTMSTKICLFLLRPSRLDSSEGERTSACRLRSIPGRIPSFRRSTLSGTL